MRLSDVNVHDWVRLVDSPRFGIHAGQTMLVVNIERDYSRGRASTFVIVECEDEHALPVKAADLRPVTGQED